MGSTPLPAGDTAQRHLKVTAFVSRSAAGRAEGSFRLLVPISSTHSARSRMLPGRQNPIIPSRSDVAICARLIGLGIGAAAGQTPIANLSLTWGAHQLVFRRPELSERQQTVVVTASGLNRIAGDLTR